MLPTSTSLHSYSALDVNPASWPPALLFSPHAPLQVYVRRLIRLAQEQPEGLLVHAYMYLSYLGNLSRGQIIRRRLAKQLSLFPPSASSGDKAEDVPTPGLTFFEFSRLDEQGREDMADKANKAFR
ncbi:hypothetical protein CALVIDRAFT_563967 [Calocera viscosa TUFC12733]|uniref:Heme oxygenase-like protein n=1 Tax=Calocera viscosa (strain TUFC12733) TaxID=1330018 RepID=A0A167M9W9_CALVF|nr:hypothetical protein CALVIDRAFT_563967 [Calocera viscosa TUFC12733]